MSFLDKVNGTYINTLYKNYGKEIGVVTSKDNRENTKNQEKVQDKVNEENELEV